MNYCEKGDIRFELLKGVNTYDKLKCENEEVSMKDALKKIGVNNERSFIGAEQGRWINTSNVLVITHKDMMTQCREWMKENYGRNWKLKGNK